MNWLTSNGTDTTPRYRAKNKKPRQLRYLDLHNVDFIVLDAQYVSNFPEAPGWIKNHIPDQRAQLIYELGTDPKRKIAIDRWDKR